MRFDVLPTRQSLRLSLVVFCLIGMCLCRTEAIADTGLETDWGGHLRAIGTVTWVDPESIYQFAEPDPYYDGQAEMRLKNRLYMGSRWTLQTHYELVVQGGDTRENSLFLEDQLPTSLAQYGSLFVPINDDRRLFDLTRVIAESDRTLVYHRLDRLNLTYAPDWGTVRLGRQALTWGDGLVFNPMDLFNPFAPTSVQRDYKTGDDMAHLQLPIGEAELQLLYLPRRDPSTGDIETDASSWAMKYHTPVGPLEMDLMAAHHYDDQILGLGASGYLGDAAWRLNTVYTHLNRSDPQDDFFQIVANLDYAWMWGGKNVYGLVEFYYNGLGRSGDYAQTVDNLSLLERLARGELFTIGRPYLAGQLLVELHPLAQLHTTAIVNLADPSGVLQPQIVYDVVTDWQIIFGGQWHWGGSDSEYGGYALTAGDTTITVAPADRVYLWLTYYF